MSMSIPDDDGSGCRRRLTSKGKLERLDIDRHDGFGFCLEGLWLLLLRVVSRDDACA